MSDLTVHFSSAETDWITPPEVFDPLNAQYAFALDVCAADETSARVENFIPPAIDTLQVNWSEILGPGDWWWMNPVYGEAIEPCIDVSRDRLLKRVAEEDVFGRLAITADPRSVRCEKISCARFGPRAAAAFVLTGITGTAVPPAPPPIAPD